jgi:hypothetical protein
MQNPGAPAGPHVGGHAPVANTGNSRSFGNPGFGGANHAVAGTGGNHINNVNRTSFVSTGANFNGQRGVGYIGRSPYNRYHRGWYNGNWCNYGGFGYGGFGYPFGLGFGLGLGFGYGGFGGYGGYGYGGYGGLGYCMPNWLYGSALYGYGYTPYSNPYYISYAGAATPYDYSQPINTVSPASVESVPDDALALFGSARDSFKQGNYEVALQQANDALTKTPSDTALHEFRGLCLFALGRYDEAATTLYAVLAAGPGWDWPTLIGLYPNVDVYTTQFRALEALCKANPQSATGRFVLAYLYVTEGYLEDAAKVLKQVVALKPSDTISAKLLEQIEAVQQNKQGAEAVPPPPVSVPANAMPPEGATITGAWNAQPGADTSIVLTIQPGGAFTWQVTQKGQTQQFAGVSAFGGGVLTLAQDNGTVLVGRVSWKDPANMTFRVIGDGPNDPGLSFSK